MSSSALQLSWFLFNLFEHDIFPICRDTNNNRVDVFIVAAPGMQFNAIGVGAGFVSVFVPAVLPFPNSKLNCVYR